MTESCSVCSNTNVSGARLPSPSRSPSTHGEGGAAATGSTRNNSTPIFDHKFSGGEFSPGNGTSGDRDKPADPSVVHHIDGQPRDADNEEKPWHAWEAASERGGQDDDRPSRHKKVPQNRFQEFCQRRPNWNKENGQQKKQPSYARSEPGTEWGGQRNRTGNWQNNRGTAGVGSASQAWNFNSQNRRWDHDHVGGEGQTQTPKRQVPASEHSSIGGNSERVQKRNNAEEERRQEQEDRQDEHERRNRESYAWRPQPMDPESQKQLRHKMQQSVQKINEGWSSERRLSTAMAAIEEIPKRVGEDMHKVASHVVDNVQCEVAAIGMKILDDVKNFEAKALEASGCRIEWKAKKANAVKVVKNLEVIPTMVANLLEARVEKAKALVRHRIKTMMMELSAIDEERNSVDQDQLILQMRKISADVENIAGQAVEAAAEECRLHANRQVDFAMSALLRPGLQATEEIGEKKPHVELRAETGASQFFQQKDQGLWVDRIGDRGEEHQKLEEAVQMVQDKEYVPQCISNQVVAAELLRAKVRHADERYRNKDESAKGAAPTNPGSVGHPHICRRPCLYFTSNICSNGDRCGFCHMPHPKRPVRLDKRQREALNRMPYDELLAMLVPVIKSKVGDLVDVKKTFSGNGNNPTDIFQENVMQAEDSVGNVKDEVLQLLERLKDTAIARAASAADAEGQSHVGLESKGSLSQETTAVGDYQGYCKTRRSMAGSSACSSVSASESESRSIWKKDAFVGSLQVMGVRSLLTMLGRLAPMDAVEERQVITQVLHIIKYTNDTQDDVPMSASQSGVTSLTGVQPSARQLEISARQLSQMRVTLA
eukprot:TRINITY_DN8779_c0_g1_i2.p1 TRINITY_DN8779_c0_g1~~TRINITY_DN8779_c0_g1_i2.p1  ORF type:complete len:828 (+),score=188.03 TRINITY_DN8779_c0_g1_i2:1195-3678(+)